jgi:hypothetical protein
VTGARDAVTPATTRGKGPAHDPASDFDCVHEQARELLLRLHHLPSHEHSIVGCRRYRPA